MDRIIVYKSLKEITPYEKNPRDNLKAVRHVKNSIEQFGFKVPLVIDKDGVIVAGHTRYLAALELGMNEVPCVVASDLNDRQVKAFRIADNKTGELATWDFDLLSEELNDLKIDFDMSDFGFDVFSEIEDTGEEEPDEEIPADNGFNYKEQYGVIIICKDELEQEHIYQRMLEEGYECKVVAT